MSMGTLVSGSAEEGEWFSKRNVDGVVLSAASSQASFGLISQENTSFLPGDLLPN